MLGTDINLTTLSSLNPLTSSRTITIPATMGNADIVLTEIAQTINGPKTLSSALTITQTTSQLILGTTRTATINAVTPATASRVYTVIL
jgi:hypothetical protein